MRRWPGLATEVPDGGRALQMPDVLQLGNGGDGGDVVFAHVQDVGWVHPSRLDGGERFACAVEGFDDQLRTKQPLAAERGDGDGGERVETQMAHGAGDNGQFAGVSRDGKRGLQRDAEVVVAAAVFFLGKGNDGLDVFGG